MKRALLSLLCLVAGGASGCRPQTDERLGLEEKRAGVRVEPAELATGFQLERAIATPAAEVAARLRSYRLTATAALHIGAGDRGESFDESWKLEFDAHGASHVLTENSHGYGFETVAIDKSIYVRPRYGRYARRPAEGDEVERTQEGVQGVLSGYLGVLGRFAQRRDEGSTMVAGRKVRRIRLSLAPLPARLGELDPAQAWRKGMKVSELAGVVEVDEETGAPLHATLDAAWTAERPPAREAGAATTAAGTAVRPARPASAGSARAVEIAVKLSYRADVDQIGLVPAIVAPEGALPSVARVRPQLDRQALLEGLVGSAAPGAASDR